MDKKRKYYFKKLKNSRPNIGKCSKFSGDLDLRDFADELMAYNIFFVGITGASKLLGLSVFK